MSDPVPFGKGHADALLAWYGQNRRTLPFREDPTPYHIWISEIMLQQTRVTAMLPYYERFMAALPDVAALARCPEEQLFKLWEGLGYYSRARNLRKAAGMIMEQYGGHLPASKAELLSLPGIGPYTGGAIASIAFGLPEVAVDGNVLRVFSRLFCFEQDVARPQSKKHLSQLVQQEQPPQHPGDYNQALMELGALVCLPQNPRCSSCPVTGFCGAKAEDKTGLLPKKGAKPAKPNLPVCVLIVRSGRQVLLHKRPEKGLLAGLWEPVVFEGQFSRDEAQQKLTQLLPGAQLDKKLPAASHVFTHKVWKLYGWTAHAPVPTALGQEYVWADFEDVSVKYAIPAAFNSYRFCIPSQN